MGLQAYRAVLRIREVRRVLLLGLLVRVPMWAGAVVLTLHVVTHLGRSYGAAGFVEGASTVAASISSPWRGRRLDQVGLRKAVVPSLVVLTVCWSIAPFTGYWLLIVLASFAGLFIVPQFTIVRQSLLASVPEVHRKSALSIDSVAVEISYMMGPALGVLLATYWATSWALFTCEFTAVLGGALIWLVNPRLRSDDDTDADADAPSGVRSWLGPVVAAVLVMSAATVLVLVGSDVGTVAALRHMHHQSWIGWELAVWGLGSAVGGLVYGAVRFELPVWVLLALLGATAIPVALATGPGLLAVLLFVTGLFCAPTITASVSAIGQVVGERGRGEALGWHGSAMTAGAAAGAPLAGVAIDHVGWHGGFVLPGLVGLAIAAAGALVYRGRSAPGSPASGSSAAGSAAAGSAAAGQPLPESIDA
ncbi:MFS transporter [uncultured Jatrophihabitans sp.]|uniref:MFS transporter n=1 Tax=uncultured Jatrophihabitans sp. TaxID=1610747 RepID=UPI0035CC42A0